MATNSKSVEAIVGGDDPVGEQDRRKFKPLRAIKRMFKGKKKSKGFSQSMGSMLSPSYDDTPSLANLARSISHESVFAKDGVATGLPENATIRTVLSVGDVTEVPINRLKVSLTTEEVISTSSMSKVTSVDQKVKGKEDATAEGKNEDVLGNMNDLTTDVTRLNNKLAYDKISVRPKRRPARNARGAQQTHVIRVEETPAAVNGFDEDELTHESQERKPRDLSPAPSSTKATLHGLQIPSITEDNNATDPPKRPLRKSPIGGVPTGFVPSLQDVQAFKKRSKRMEESTDPVAPKPKQNAVDAVVAKADVAEKSKKSPKSSKKAHKKSGESSSSVFSWKNKTKSPASPRKAKASDIPKDETKSKGLFSGLKTKKSTDKDSKSSSTIASKLFFQGDKKEQTRKKSSGNEPSKEKKEIVDVHQNNKTKIADKDKQEDVTDTKEKITTETDHKAASTVVETTQAQFSPPLHGRIRSPGGMSLFDEINSEMTRKMKSKFPITVEKENSVPKHEDAPKSINKHSAEKKEISTAKSLDSDTPTTVNLPWDSSIVSSKNAESRSNTDISASASETSTSIQNKPVPIVRVKMDIDTGSKSESPEQVDQKSMPTTRALEVSNNDSSVTEVPTEKIAALSTVVKHSEVANAKPVIDEPATEETTIIDSSVTLAKESAAKISPIISSVKIESENLDAERSTVESVSQKDHIAQTPTDAATDRTSIEADLPNKETLTNAGESYSSGTKLDEPVSLQTATDSAMVTDVSNEVEPGACEVSENMNVASPATEILSKDIASTEVRKDKAQTNTVAVDSVNTKVSVKPNSVVESTDSAKSDLLSPSATQDSQSVTDLFSKAKLKPVSRNAANRKSASVRIAPRDPTPKPLRPHSWNSKEGAADPEANEDSKASLIKAEPTSTHQSNPIKKPRLALKPTSPVKIRDKPSFSKSPDEQSLVKSPDKQRPIKYSDKPSPLKSPDKPFPLNSPDQSSPVKSPINSLILKSPDKPSSVKRTDKSSPVKSPEKSVSANSPVKPPPVKSPDKQPSEKSMDQDAENNNVFNVTEAEAKPVLRRTSERQKQEDSGKGSGSEPSWIKIARRRSKHWEDGELRPKSSSNPTPAAPGSDKPRPHSVSAAPKQRSLSSSKAEVQSPRNISVSPTRNMQSNRTSCIPAISSSPTSKSSPTAKETPSSGQGKPSWLAIAMQKQKSWGAKEEMV